MNREEVEKMVLESLDLCNQARPADDQITVAKDTQLFGNDGCLDSMGLVGLLLDIEDALLDGGVELMLSDEKAMSEKRSPFKDVSTLTDYIVQRLQQES